jgi:hypothetical protein
VREIELSLRADAAPEVYDCYGFDAAALDGAFIRGIRWTPPVESPVILHHAGLFASPHPVVPGPVSCESMPAGSMALHVWAPGAGALSLPDDIALVLPPGTRSLVVQAHALRLRAGTPGVSKLTLSVTDHPPLHTATWRRADAPVPEIPPHQRVSSTGTCRAVGELHILSTRPHMHQLGKELHARIARRDGTYSPFVDIQPWVWDFQKTFPVDVVLAPGDGIETTCTWENPKTNSVKEGLLVTDEMCQQGMIVWPLEHAGWEGPCK